MRTARTVVGFGLLLIIANPVFAASAKKSTTPKSSIAYYRTIDRALLPVTLTDEQKTKLDALKKDYEQKFVDAYAKRDVMTPDQKMAADGARKAAREAGKTGKDVTKAVADAVKLTDEQKAKTKEANAAVKALQTEFKDKVMALLTEQQKQQVLTAPKSVPKPKTSAKSTAAK